MTTRKAKLDTSRPRQRLVDEFLFIRAFDYEINLPLDQAITSLNQLSYRPGKVEGVFFPRRRTVKIQQIDPHTAHFEVKIKLGGMYTEVTARGRLDADPATGNSIISGDVKFGSTYFTVLMIGLFFLITWTLASITRSGNLASPFLIFTLGITNLFYLRQMFLDRNSLIEQIVTQLTSAETVNHATTRLADTDRNSAQSNVDNSTQASDSQEKNRY